MRDNRHFIGSICVRIGTVRTKIELSPASIHGGGDGFRVRVNRRWIDTPDGELVFLQADRLGQLVANVALGGVPTLKPTPDLPAKTRVSLRQEKDGIVWHDGAWTVSPPIRGYDGRCYVALATAEGTIDFVPVDNLVWRKCHENRR